MMPESVEDSTVRRRNKAPLSLRRNFTWTFFGNVVYAACQWGMLAAIAQVLSSVEVGQYALALGVTAPVFLFSSLKLRSVIATDANDEFELRIYVWTRIAITGLALSAVVVATWIIDLSAGYKAIVIVVALIKYTDGLGDILQGFMQKSERMDMVSRGMMINGTVSLFLLYISLIVTGELIWGLVGSLAGSVLVVTLYFFPGVVSMLAAERGDRLAILVGRPRLRDMRSLIKSSWPLGVSISLGSLKTNVPIYFIQMYLGISAVGIYSALSYIKVAGSLVINALGQAATPRLSQLFHKEKTSEFIKLTLYLVLTGVGLGLVGVLASAVAGEFVLQIAYGSEFADSAGLLTLLMVAAAVSYSYIFLGTAICAMRQFWVQMPIGIAATLSLALACPVLTSQYGLKGAAASVILSAAVEGSLYLTIIVRKIQQQNSPTRLNWHTK